MINQRTTFLLLFFICVNLLSAQPVEKNQYGLAVISDTAKYRAWVAENPDKGLVNLVNYVPDAALDIRYATPNNFTGEVIYKAPLAFARKPVAEALQKVQSELARQGIGLLIFDAYRPYEATVKFYEVYPDKNFVASPKTGSVHNRGGAVDVSLIDLESGKPLKMPTPFDDFTEKASHGYHDLPEEALKNRQTLKEVMVKHGFKPYEAEWWHYSYKDYKGYEILDIPFKVLGKKNHGNQ